MLKKLFLLAALLGCLAAQAWAGVMVNGELTRIHNVQPGDKTEGVLVLKNTGTESASVKIYQTDYLFSSDGSNHYGKPGELPRSNAAWITLYPADRITIPPSATASINYSLQVPARQDLTGSYWSMVMLELLPEASGAELSGEKGRIKAGVQTILRYGIQIVANIGDSGTRNVKFLEKKLSYAQGKKTLELDIENTGERELKPLVYVELFNADGTYAGKFECPPTRFYPGCSIKCTFDLSSLAKGTYKTLVVADNGDEYVFGAQYDLTLD